jgi:maltose/moltooligosaccharide transporter
MNNEKPRLNFWQIWNMSFGFMGIQFGFELQNSNVSRIFETLGANKDEIPLLWIAAPATGLLVQPIIGYLSDRTWHPTWGRRRPFFFIGAVLASIALIFMPNSSALWIAGGMLWIMDASINISMEPFRAYVGDMLPSEQRTTGFAMQSFFIGIGSIVAALLPWIFTNWFDLPNTAPAGQIPPSVKWSFYLGAFAFFSCVLYTILTSKEYPPDDLEAFKKENEQVKFMEGVKETFLGIFKMPKTMTQLAVVQFFTWFALFCMWIYTNNAVTNYLYGTSDPTSALYNEGANWVNVCSSIRNFVAAIGAFLIPWLAQKTSRKLTHTICLCIGGIGLFSINFIPAPVYLAVSMGLVGIAWASILSMPYAMLAGALPSNKMGYYMGVFNFFIVIPQIVASGSLGFITTEIFGGNTLYTIAMGGGSMILAGLLCLAVKDIDDVKG